MSHTNPHLGGDTVVTMLPEDLLDQAGMERAFQRYFVQVHETGPGSFNDMLGASFLACDRENRILRLALQPESWMANPGGILHGGIIASWLDLAMGLICRYYSGGIMTPTLHGDVSYLRTGTLTDRLCVEAHLTKPGRTVCYTTGQLYPMEHPERLIATAAGSYYSGKT